MNIADEIQRLQQLHESGALTSEEFAQAKAAVLAGQKPPQTGAATCFQCDSTPRRACALCGHMFCDQHGGERWVWVSKSGGSHGARNLLTKRVICDDCTPDQATMKRRVTFLIILFAVVIGFILLTFLGMFAFCAGFLF